MSRPLSGCTSLMARRVCEGQPEALPGKPQWGLRSTLTHIPLDPLVHEALHVHVSNGILGAVEGQEGSGGPRKARPPVADFTFPATLRGRPKVLTVTSL